MPLADTALAIVSQKPEVVEDCHLQVGPRESVRQPLADGVKDAHSWQLLDAQGTELQIVQARRVGWVGDACWQREARRQP